MPPAEQGNTVKVAYTGKLEDGSIFDTSENQDPLEFTLGSKQVIPGFENAVVGMDVDDKKTVTIPSEQAYGLYHEELVNIVNRDSLPKDLTPQVGQVMAVKIDEDNSVEVVITEMTDATVTLDANLPLAGKTLIFDIELLEIA